MTARPGRRDRVAVVRDDALDRGTDARRQRHHLVARADDARGDGAGEAAEVEIRPGHDLDRQPEPVEVQPGLDIDGLQMGHQWCAVEPAHVLAGVDDVVAEQGRHRQEVGVDEIERLGEVAVVVADLVEALLRPVDEVHLVDRHHDVADAEQARDEAVPFRLCEHAVAGIDQDDGELAVRGPGRHVAGVLLVTRCVGDDELALRRREVAVRHIDRDALLAFGLQAVGQQREVDLIALGARRGRVGLERGQLSS